MDFLDRWYFVVALIAFPVVLLHLNEFDPFELFCLNVVVMQERFLSNLERVQRVIHFLKNFFDGFLPSFVDE